MPFFSQQRTNVIARRDGAMPAPDPAGTAASSLLKRYHPLETRATGGFGSVEICLDSRLKRRVAIKRIPLAPENAAEPVADPLANAPAPIGTSTAAALAEARTASMLQHPNIVSVIDFTYDAAFAYLVMEYVDGMSLEEFLEQVEGHSLTYDEAACVADALVQALAYAHENRVLHLDIKPANVLIDRSGHVKLADFGMASLSSAAGFGGARGGTIGYMPPEQLEGREVDERTDVFALATVLYQALCASAPFAAPTAAESLDLIGRGAETPSDLLPDLPQTTEYALLDALEPDPAARIASVQDFGDRFCYQLGSAREGRRSLARIVARLTSDDAAPAAGDTLQAEAARPDETRPPRDIDPAEGVLGSRWPWARRATCGVVTGASVAYATWLVLEAMHVADTAGGPAPILRLLAALVVGAAGGFAPQVGSALAFTALAAMIANAIPLLPAIPVLTLLAATGAGWWLTWGRSLPAASAALTLAIACATAAGAAPGTLSPGAASILAAVPAAAIAGYFLAPVSAAAALALAGPVSALASTAFAQAGRLGIWDALATLAAPAPWVSAIGLGALAAALSALISWAGRHLEEGSGMAALAAPIALPLMVAPLLAWLVNPMEIPSSSPMPTAMGAGVGCLSSIIVWICVYSLGYGKDPSEGDRS